MKNAILFCFSIMFYLNLNAQQGYDTTVKAMVNGMSGGSFEMFTDPDYPCCYVYCSDSTYKIISCTVSMTIKGDLIEQDLKEGKSTASTLYNFGNLRSGDKIYYSNIKARTPDNRIVKLKPITFYVE